VKEANKRSVEMSLDVEVNAIADVKLFDFPLNAKSDITTMTGTTKRQKDKDIGKKFKECNKGTRVIAVLVTLMRDKKDTPTYVART
jgi:hypothetical protein